ncbi:MAG: dynamin family protein, partial [Rhodobacteraceae bacterium]|nr:dynamin family protein [Paracoccaceae bacterium]
MNIEVSLDQATQLLSSARPTNLKLGMDVATDFANDVAQLNKLLQTLDKMAGPETSQSVARLRRYLAEFEPNVTLLGQVKSGKTSLVNAMAGWADLLPSDVNPWTSVVTSLHLTPDSRRHEVAARFSFMSEDEWSRLLTRGGRLGELAGRSGADSELKKIQTQVQSVWDKARQRLGRKFELLLGQQHEYGYFDKNLLERYTCLGDDFDTETDADDDNGQGKFADITQSADLYL